MPNIPAEKRPIINRTVKWSLVAPEGSELEKTLRRLSDGIREYQVFALERIRTNEEAHKKCQERAEKEGIHSVRFLDENNLVCLKEFLSKDEADAFREEILNAVAKSKEAIHAQGKKKRGKNDPLPPRLLPRLLTPETVYQTLYMSLREEDRMTDDGFMRNWRGRVPANWVLESVFRKIASAYQSFFTLRKRGDPHARTIGNVPKKSEGHSRHFRMAYDDANRFVEIQGALSQGSYREGFLVLAPEVFPDLLVFPVPSYQAQKLEGAKRLTKFVIDRTETDLRKPAKYSISVSYEIEVPDTIAFVPEEAVYVALGASCIGIVSPKGEEVIKLWRPDGHWMPEIELVESYLRGMPRGNVRPALSKGSLKWQDLLLAKNTMFKIMANQQTLNRREVVIRNLVEREVPVKMSARARRHRLKHGKRLPPNLLTKLLGHGRHFVVTDLVVRSKEGKLADSSKKERGGILGRNRSVSSTGTIGYLERCLEEKVREHGGSVQKHTLPAVLPTLPTAPDERKIPIARVLRKDFLRTCA